MCRIAGIISKHTDPESIYEQVTAMCDSMIHGGPDDGGVYINNDIHIGLGNRRLSLQDLTSAGHQPMMAFNNKLYITFNGEIYNFKELRSELKGLGYFFKTESDTEVILVAYQCWNVKAFERFKGMFAFALVDNHLNKTYLVRDPSGIKPLYYSTSSSSLIFSSEVKAFLKTSFEFKTNEKWKVFILALGHIPEPFTNLDSVVSLKKGSYMTWDNKSSSYSTTIFSTFQYTEQITDINYAIETVKNSIEKSVKRHLISDAPIGVFLSGGIDSSILTLVANRFEKENLNTLSVQFEETDYSEKRFQALVNQQTNARHNDYVFNYKAFTKHFDTIISAMDQPSTDGINSWFVSKCAKENGLKAVLSGLGADELFGGYPSFQRMHKLATLKMLPKALLRLSEHSNDHRFRRLYYLSYDNPIGEYLFLRGFFTPRTIASILDSDHKEVDDILSNFTIDDSIKSLKNGNRASWLETNLYMENQLLKDTDYMSMSHGIEVRVPYLDQDLIAAVLNIRHDIKFNKQQPKSLLISAFKNVLPEPIWNRKKMGFTFPFQEWMRKYKKISDHNLYAGKTSKQLMNDFGEGKLHWSSAFALYHIQKAF
jgi:asparagine synthase (glutamine-hydrolysing)